MKDDTARTRFATLLAKCAGISGLPGGLLAEESEEFRRLAEELGVEIVEWRRFNLLTQDWETHELCSK